MRRALAAALLLCVAGCGGTTNAPPDSGRTLTVLAAASLTEPFTALAEDFEAERTTVQVRLAFDSSATLAGQVVQGAPADVLATADDRTMAEVVAAGATAVEPSLFATNTMVLVVPAGNPAGVDTFADLDRGDVAYVTCADSAPCGALGQSLLDANGIENEPSSLEVDVKAVLNKVVLDEADAGLVYASDAVAAGDAVETVPIPGSEARVNRYLLAPLRRSAQPDLARAWVDLVLSGPGQAVLRDAGFGDPGRAP